MVVNVVSTPIKKPGFSASSNLIQFSPVASSTIFPFASTFLALTTTPSNGFFVTAGFATNVNTEKSEIVSALIRALPGSSIFTLVEPADVGIVTSFATPEFR